MDQLNKNKKDITGLGLISGGLDSLIATLLIKKQNINVIGLNFKSPFCICDKSLQNSECGLNLYYEKLDIKVHTHQKTNDYLDVIKNPKYGYGKNLNPCIDCRIYIINKAKKFAQDVNADFIFTGEVLNQRPKSQNRDALKIIERETNLEKKLVRPLSALLLEPTIFEESNLLDRSKLLDIQGRSRKRQLEIAKKSNLLEEYYACGGCLLTDKNFSNRLRDLMKYNQYPLTMNDVKFLKYGRHFRYGKSKIIVGRSERENKILKHLKREQDLIIRPKNVMGPITLVMGDKNSEIVEFASKLTLRYSDLSRNHGNVIIENSIIAEKEIMVVLDQPEEYMKSFLV
jgi:tRNA U34 2-thiouridine synthase MnmA/TrmU